MKFRLIKILIAIVILCVGYEPSAQNANDYLADNELFIYLVDGTLLRKGQFKDQTRTLNSRYYFPSGNRIYLRSILYLNTKNGYFAIRKGNYISRVDDGYFNVFKAELHTYGPMRADYKSMLGGSQTSKKVYYSIELGTLKRARYSTISKDYSNPSNGFLIKQNELILTYLEKGRRSKRTKQVVMVTGLGLLASGLTSLGSKQILGIDKTEGRVLMGIGLGTFVTSLFLIPDKYYRKSLQEFNRTFNGQ
ncbi:MAG: hypothetical protein AB8F74_15980 [Saprospiraceae bacterium]